MNENPKEVGLASWYGPGFHGKQTASGAMFDASKHTAAHRTLPFGTRVEVVDEDSGRAVVVRITDRGPFKPDRVIDLSEASARSLGIIDKGLSQVSVQVLD
jgi:rare lipoprotein A